jgi:hypothetical protein
VEVVDQKDHLEYYLEQVEVVGWEDDYTEEEKYKEDQLGEGYNDAEDCRDYDSLICFGVQLHRPVEGCLEVFLA